MSLGNGEFFRGIMRIAEEANLPAEVSNRMILAGIYRMVETFEVVEQRLSAHASDESVHFDARTKKDDPAALTRAKVAGATAHVADEKVHTPRGLLRKEVLAWLVVLILLVEALSPADLSLWDLIRRLAGL